MALRKARYQLQTGEMAPAEYYDLKKKLLEDPGFAPARSYAKLTDSVSNLPARKTEGSEVTDLHTAGFLTVKQEDHYLQSLDAYLNGVTTNPRSHAAHSLAVRSQEKSADRERDAQLRNPVSVYNWLRKNRPNVFLQDSEPGAEKPARPAGARSSKRNANRDSIVKQGEEMYDDEGVAVDSAANRGKRKRDDDGGYRPKGGNSRPTKRKKEEPPPPPSGRRSKKSSVDVR